MTMAFEIHSSLNGTRTFLTIKKTDIMQLHIREHSLNLCGLEIFNSHFSRNQTSKNYTEYTEPRGILRVLHTSELNWSIATQVKLMLHGGSLNVFPQGLVYFATEDLAQWRHSRYIIKTAMKQWNIQWYIAYLFSANLLSQGTLTCYNI